jgi:hypothetical protein
MCIMMILKSDMGSLFLSSIPSEELRRALYYYHIIPGGQFGFLTLICLHGCSLANRRRGQRHSEEKLPTRSTAQEFNTIVQRTRSRLNMRTRGLQVEAHDQLRRLQFNDVAHARNRKRLMFFERDVDIADAGRNLFSRSP